MASAMALPNTAALEDALLSEPMHTGHRHKQMLASTGFEMRDHPLEEETKLIHRLDKQVAGVMALARNRYAAASFHSLLAVRICKRVRDITAV